MNRDGVKTILGLLVIGLIIVATFLYGNQQRQAQLQRDQDLKRGQQNVAQSTPKSQSTTTASTKPQPGVPAPSSNPIQGQGAAPSKSVAPRPSSTPIPTPATTPKTGPEATAVMGLLVLVGASVFYTRGRRKLAVALATHKSR